LDTLQRKPGIKEENWYGSNVFPSYGKRCSRTIKINKIKSDESAAQVFY
jgi:hypothetical protein